MSAKGPLLFSVRSNTTIAGDSFGFFRLGLPWLGIGINNPNDVIDQTVFFTPCELPFASLTPARSCRLSPFGRLIAAIIQHIPDMIATAGSNLFQLVRYYGWYSNKIRGQRSKLAESGEGAKRPPDSEVEIIDVSDHHPRRLFSKKWRELIKKVWEADPLICPTCSREMRIVALIDESAVIERILRHLGLWEEGVRLNPARAPPDGEGIAASLPSLRASLTSCVELFSGNPFPDYSMEPVMEYDLCAEA